MGVIGTFVSEKIHKPVLQFDFGTYITAVEPHICNTMEQCSDMEHHNFPKRISCSFVE
jgi:hypothetical protein